jgi:acyl carrier protein
MKSNESKQMIREFVQNLLVQKKDTRPFTDDASMIMAGRLDSIDTVELVLFLETAFGLTFGNSGFRRAQLDTVNTIDQLIRGSKPV